MKIKKKKLTATQKAEIKTRIKKASLTLLHVLSYILSICFIIVCVVAGLQSCNGKPKKVTNNQTNNAQVNEVVSRSRANEPKTLASNRIFYPSDIEVGTGLKYYTHLNFSNYNYLQYFMPTGYDFLHFDNPQNISIDTLTNSSTISLDLYQNGEVGFVVPSPSGGSSITVSGLSINFDYTDSDNYRMYLDFYRPNHTQSTRLMSWTYSNGDLTSYTFNGLLSPMALSVFDYIFTFDNGVYFYCQGVTSNTDIIKKLDYTQRFFAYYLSNYSFDYNAYVFGGSDKYVSFTYLFNRIYNGFFIYYPGHSDLSYTFSLFKGAWEYHNTIFDSVYVELQRAWNGTIIYPSPATGLDVSMSYEVTYAPLRPLDNPWYNSIFYGDNPGLVNYYFINSIYMTNVYGDSVTLAYNSILNRVIPDSSNPASYIYDTKCYTPNNLRLFQDDSFLLNKNIEFVVYSIKYDGSFHTNTPFIAYSAYSDFFFTAFYYTGIYHTTPPIGTDVTYPFSPIFGMMSNALTGLLPALNLYLMPGLTLGTLLILPFVVSIILFVVKLFKR